MHTFTTLVVFVHMFTKLDAFVHMFKKQMFLCTCSQTRGFCAHVHKADVVVHMFTKQDVFLHMFAKLDEVQNTQQFALKRAITRALCKSTSIVNL